MSDNTSVSDLLESADELLASGPTVESDTPEPGFACDECDERFFDSLSLERHKAFAHEMPWDKAGYPRPPEQR